MILINLRITRKTDKRVYAILKHKVFICDNDQTTSGSKKKKKI